MVDANPPAVGAFLAQAPAALAGANVAVNLQGNVPQGQEDDAEEDPDDGPRAPARGRNVNPRTIRGDVLVTHRYNDGYMKFVDVVVKHPTPSVPGRFTIPGAAAVHGERVKNAWYGKYFENTSTHVVPLAYDTYGFLGATGVKFLQSVSQIARRNGAVLTGSSPSWYVSTKRRLAVRLQKSNAAITRAFVTKCLGVAVAE